MILIIYSFLIINIFSAIVVISTKNSKGCLLKFEAQCLLLIPLSLFISLPYIFSKVADGKIKTWLYNMYVFKRY